MGICLWYTLAYLISRSTASPVLMRAIPVRSGGRGRRGLSHRGYRLPDDPSRSVEGRQTRARAISCTSLEPHTSQEDRLMLFSSARTAPSQHTSRRTSGARFPTNGDGVDGTASGLDAAKQGLHMSIDRGAHRGASAVEHQCFATSTTKSLLCKTGANPPRVCEPQDTCANRRDRVPSACEHRQPSSLFDVHFTRPSSRPSRSLSRSSGLSSRFASSRRVRENPTVTHSTLASRSSRALSHTISRSLPCDPMSTVTVLGLQATGDLEFITAENLRVGVPGPVAIAVSARRLLASWAGCGRVRRGHRCSDSPRSASPSPCLA